MTVSILKTKLQSLRNSFSKELTLIKESSRSGAGAEDIYVPKYPFYNELLFLQPVMKKRPSTTNLVNYFLYSGPGSYNSVCVAQSRTDLNTHCQVFTLSSVGARVR